MTPEVAEPFWGGCILSFILGFIFAVWWAKSLLRRTMKTLIDNPELLKDEMYIKFLKRWGIYK